MRDKDVRYIELLLEEIRHLTAENLLMQARIYDNLRSANGLAKEDPTYELATDFTDESYRTVTDFFENNKLGE